MAINCLKEPNVSKVAHQILNFLCKSELEGSRIIQAVKAHICSPPVYQILSDMRGCLRVTAERSPSASIDLHQVSLIQR